MFNGKAKGHILIVQVLTENKQKKKVFTVLRELCSSCRAYEEYIRVM